MENKRFPQLCDNKTCTGCMACVNVCAHGALTFTKDDEGFYRPLLNADKCVKCGLCEKTCPIITPVKRQNERDLKVYAAWHKDEAIRAKSTSGGAFSALASVVLGKGGVVYGASYTDDLTIKHIEVSDDAGLDKLRLSKYAQSHIGDIFQQVKKRLFEGCWVMFVGTPCQVAGLKNYLHKDYDNLILVDFYCHGVPSIDLFQQYAKWLEAKHGKIQNFVFRDKRKGWYDSLRVIEKANGNHHILRGNDDAYWESFNHYDNSMQECCYACKVQGLPRISDITIADFWRIGQHVPFAHIDEIEKGVSSVAVNNPRLLSFIQEAEAFMCIEPRTIEESIKGNPASVKSSIRPKDRDTLYKDLRVMSFDDLRCKYMTTTWKQKSVKIFREYLPYPIIKYVRLRKQK